jgi:soluble lytic murein transglycosylase
MRCATVLAGVIVLCLGGASARAVELSADDDALYRQAFDLIHKRRFDLALAAIPQATDRRLAKVLEEQYYAAANSGAPFDQIVGFLRANPDWPQRGLLERRAEEAITDATPKSALVEWFDGHAPVTVAGVMAYAQALQELGRGNQAAELARKFWVSGTLDDGQQHQFLDKFGTMLRAGDDLARLDRLLWSHQEAAARLQMPRVDADHKLLAAARLALGDDASNAETLAAALPASVKDDPGLIYEWVRYRRNHDDDDGAIQLLRDPAHDQGRPDLWWTERTILIHRALQKGNVSVAYDIAQTHGQTTDAIEAEWLSGWIALRFLNDARQGLDHFSRFYDHVATPRNRARAAYWAGRAAEALGQGDEAVRWFNLAAQNVTTFYGQLAEDHLGPDRVTALPPAPEPLPADIARFDQLEATQLALLLSQIKEGDLARVFLVKAFELSQTPGEKVLAADLATSLGQPDIAVTIARQSERQGNLLIQFGYPLLHLEGNVPEQALVLSLILKESAFHSDLVSGAGARGLMQLMPPTAAELAKSLKLAADGKDSLNTRLTRDPALNIKLGSAYVGDLLNSFSGSYVLTAAAYNAGPNRVKRWLREMGDPRTPGVDPIDWIENIPFWETRDYVERVLEATQIYRRKLGTASRPLLEQDLRR